MSLIEEALRRSKNPLPTGLPPASTTAEPRSSPQPSSPHSWSATAPQGGATSVTISSRSSRRAPRLVVASAIVGLTGVLLALGALWMTRLLTAPSPAAVVPTASIPAAPPAAPAVLPHVEAKVAPAIPSIPAPVRRPAPPKPEDAPLKLSGVVEGLGEPYAVINGLIVGVGERVGEATVLQITSVGVKLRTADGKETVLRVPR